MEEMGVVIAENIAPRITGNTFHERALAAKQYVEDMNYMMAAALQITTQGDWILIAGKPYLQASGTAKVARLLGVSQQIEDGYPKQIVDAGYPMFVYRMKFWLGEDSVVIEGTRSGKDEFFSKGKSVDEIDVGDVMKAAQTNCFNVGIKRLIPGLQNLSAEAIESLGKQLNNGTGGYTFKDTSKGGKGKDAESTELFCSACGVAIEQKVASYSEGRMGARLCRDCQKLPADKRPKPKAKAAEKTALKDDLAGLEPPVEEQEELPFAPAGRR